MVINFAAAIHSAPNLSISATKIALAFTAFIKVFHIDLLRLRSVCFSWRSSLSPPPPNNAPFSSPLNLPQRNKYGNEFICWSKWGICDSANHGSYNLHKNTLYRLSSPNHPSLGWLIKVSHTTPNTFSLLIPLSTHDKLRPPPTTIPNTINLLHYRISEISNSYWTQPLNCQGSTRDMLALHNFRKVILLFDYVAACDFAVLGLEGDGALSYWRFGDDSWTPTDTKGHDIEVKDVVFCDGRCYAIDDKGVLFVLDPNMQMTVVIASSHVRNSHALMNHKLIECDSDLYLASVTCGLKYKMVCGLTPRYTEHLKVSKLNKCHGSWDRVEDLGDKIFLLCDDGSVSVSANDFHGCKGNCVYTTGLIYEDVIAKREVSTGFDSELDPYGDRSTDESRVYGERAIIYHLDTKSPVKMHKDESRTLYWPPPTWLVPDRPSGWARLKFLIDAHFSCLLTPSLTQ